MSNSCTDLNQKDDYKTPFCFVHPAVLVCSSGKQQSGDQTASKNSTISRCCAWSSTHRAVVILSKTNHVQKTCSHQMFRESHESDRNSCLGYIHLHKKNTHSTVDSWRKVSRLGFYFLLGRGGGWQGGEGGLTCYIPCPMFLKNAQLNYLFL